MRVYVGGPIYSMTRAARETAEALAIDGGTIAAVGGRAEVLAAAGEGAEVIDLAGRAMIPGFVDAHHHLALAVLYRGAVDCGPARATRIDEILQSLAAAAAKLPTDAWVIGCNYDIRGLEERRHPTREELDRACPEHPAVLLHFSYHECIANSAGLARAGIGRTTKDPPAGKIERGKRGEPTGHLFETALAPVEALARQDLLARDDGTGAFAARLRRYEDALFAVGITRVCDPTVAPSQERLYRRMHADGGLRVPILMMPIGEPGYLVPPVDRLDGATTGEGPEELRVGPMKLFFDGGHECAVCLSPGQVARSTFATIGQMIARRTWGPLRAIKRARLRLGSDLRFHAGIKYYPTDAAAKEMATRAVERGFGIAIHAMGNEAVAQAVLAIEGVRAKHRDVPPPRIEHAMFVDAAVIARAEALGIMFVMQPGFVDAATSDDVPETPDLTPFPIRTLREAGLRVAASSDTPVIDFDPMRGVRAAVSRLCSDGEPLGAAEAVSTLDAIQMYTREAARACGALDVTGTLERGKRADIAVLSRDPGALTSISEFDELVVVETILKGERVFRRAQALA